MAGGPVHRDETFLARLKGRVREDQRLLGKLAVPLAPGPEPTPVTKQQLDGLLGRVPAAPAGTPFTPPPGHNPGDWYVYGRTFGVDRPSAVDAALRALVAGEAAAVEAATVLAVVCYPS